MDAKSIGIEYCPKITAKASPIPISILRAKYLRRYSKSITILKSITISAPTAFDVSQDLGNLWVDLGFGDFTVVNEIKFVV